MNTLATACPISVEESRELLSDIGDCGHWPAASEVVSQVNAFLPLLAELLIEFERDFPESRIAQRAAARFRASQLLTAISEIALGNDGPCSLAYAFVSGFWCEGFPPQLADELRSSELVLKLYPDSQASSESEQRLVKHVFVNAYRLIDKLIPLVQQHPILESGNCASNDVFQSEWLDFDESFNLAGLRKIIEIANSIEPKLFSASTGTQSAAELAENSRLDQEAERIFDRLSAIRHGWQSRLTDGGKLREEAYQELAELLGMKYADLMKLPARKVDRHMCAAARRMERKGADETADVYQMSVRPDEGEVRKWPYERISHCKKAYTGQVVKLKITAAAFEKMLSPSLAADARDAYSTFVRLDTTLVAAAESLGHKETNGSYLIKVGCYLTTGREYRGKATG